MCRPFHASSHIDRIWASLSRRLNEPARTSGSEQHHSFSSPSSLEGSFKFRSQLLRNRRRIFWFINSGHQVERGLSTGDFSRSARSLCSSLRYIVGLFARRILARIKYRLPTVLGVNPHPIDENPVIHFNFITINDHKAHLPVSNDVADSKPRRLKLLPEEL